MDSLNRKLVEQIFSIILIAAVILSGFGFLIDTKNTLDYGGVDLRQRVVGARILIAGKDPYYFKWSPGMSELFLDPADNEDWVVSRVSVTPTVLVLHSAIANLPYLTQKFIWFILQWSFFLGTLAIFVKTSTSKIKRQLLLIMGLLFISGSYFWRLHVERGQIYVIYMFLLASAYHLSKQIINYKSLNISHFLSGFIIGFTVTIRPPVAIFAAPLLIYKQWKILIGSIIGLVAGLLCSITLSDLSIWQRYSSAMKIHGLIKLGVIKSQVRSDLVYPKLIEGMENLSEILGLPTVSTSVMGIFKLLGIQLYPQVLTLLLGITLSIICLFIIKYRKSKVSMELLFLLGAYMVLISEFFTPAMRYSYIDIQWLMPLSLIIMQFNESDFVKNKLNVLLLLSLFLSSGFNWVPFNLYISIILMILYTTLMIFFILKRDASTCSPIFGRNSIIKVHSEG
jgi:hypothetical protein